MKSLKEIIAAANENKIAIGHFNVSDMVMLKAVFESARELNTPVIIGTSEGERDFIDPYQAVFLVKNLRERYNFPIFINADHTHSLDKVEEAAKAGYDAILFDGGKLSLDENTKQTQEAVKMVRSINSNILVEGEMGYIGSGSQLLKELPAGVAIKQEDLTKPEDARVFVETTGIDILAPAVGNIHGILVDVENPQLSIGRIKEIKQATGAPLVLHGGSGIGDKDFSDAIAAGISVIHISTEMRLAWRRGVEESLRQDADEVAPYKLMGGAIEEIKKVVYNRLKLFNRL
ncbi:MAG: class II fructose-bisphosphate aldolase [bacterium]|nr:class II fructose-bisphosphate aldolase [bacterium]